MADLYNAARPEEIVFGNNMTSLTLHISRSLSRAWQPGDTILVTRLDHDANTTPWVLAAKTGCTVRWVDFHLEDGTLDLEDFEKALTQAAGCLWLCFQSLGTINPVEKLTHLAHAGALVMSMQCNMLPTARLTCSTSTAIFWFFFLQIFRPARRDSLRQARLVGEIFAYKVRPAPNSFRENLKPARKTTKAWQEFWGLSNIWPGSGKPMAQNAENYAADFSGQACAAQAGHVGHPRL